MAEWRDGSEPPRDGAGAENRSGQSSWNGYDIEQLETTIRTEIIPRLLLTFTSVPNLPHRRGIRPSDVTVFQRVIVEGDDGDAEMFVQSRLADGVDMESVLLDLLAPVARLVGEAWENDRITFVEVTIALCRMQQLLRRLTAPAAVTPVEGAGARRALFAPSPGEQHTFGLYIVEEFFRRDGWDVWTLPSSTIDEIEEAASRSWYDIAGFSLSADLPLDQLTLAIRGVRRASRNQGIRILVGGSAFLSDRSRVSVVEADGMAEDGRDAVRRARVLLSHASL